MIWLLSFLDVFSDHIDCVAKTLLCDQIGLNFQNNHTRQRVHVMIIPRYEIKDTKTLYKLYSLLFSQDFL